MVVEITLQIRSYTTLWFIVNHDILFQIVAHFVTSNVSPDSVAMFITCGTFSRLFVFL